MVAGPRTGVACQRQHWTSHKPQCRALAQREVASIVKRWTDDQLRRIVLCAPEPSDIPLLPKLTALTWTNRVRHSKLHLTTLVTRATLLAEGRPVPGESKETLLRLLKRAATELPWPDSPAGHRTCLISK
jgi:hypothetical protein